MNTETQIQTFTPAVDVFTDKVGELNAKLSQNINGYKQVDDDRSELISEVMNYDINGVRGKLAKHLIGFALDPNWWSVYAQQYNKNKVPFVIQEKPLRKLVFTYKKIKELEANDTDGETIDAYIRAFEYSIVRDIGTFAAFNSSRVNFDAKWKSQHMSFNQLANKPLKYHKVWKYFFTNPTNKSIPKLVVDIERILTFHVRSKMLQSATHYNFVNSDNVINESGLILNKGADFLKMSMQQETSVEHFSKSVPLTDMEHADEEVITRALSNGALDDEIIRALYDEERATDDSDSDSDNDSDNDSDSDNDNDSVLQKRKAMVVDTTPITNMMETLVEGVKRQKTDDINVLAMEPTTEPVATIT